MQKQIVTRLQKSLIKALKVDKKVQVRFIKLIFTGSGAAGKTSFSNLLMKKAINKVHHSTNVVQAKHAISVKKAVVVKPKQTTDNMKTTVWLEMNSDSEITHLRQVLLSTKKSTPVYERQAPSDQPKGNAKQKPQKFGNSSTKATFTEKGLLPTEYQSGSPKLSSVSHTQTIAVGKRIANIFSHSSKVKTLGTFDNIVKSALSASYTSQADKEPFHHPGEVLNIITLLDTGGQPEYIHLLPAVNIHPMVNFVVHDLSKSLEDQVLVEYSEHGEHVFEPYHLRYSNFDMIKFLMSTINDSLERPTCQVPQLVTIPGKNMKSYLCCVGTHADRVSPEIIQNTDNKLTAMVEILECKAAVWENKDGGILFPVDNTTAGDDGREDPVANFIRDKIDILSLDKDIYELPVTWMLFELEIRQVCLTQEKAYISFQECVFIASQAKLITDVEQVRSALLYHHLLGVLLYYPEVPGLCDFVIVDHQWLFDRLSNLVCYTFKQSSDSHATKKLKYSGILSKELIEDLKWDEELKETYFISLLVSMKIIAPIQREDGSGEDYFIPFVLPTYTSQSQGNDILSRYGCLQGEPLLIQFVSNLLPRGFFCCLVVQILQQLPNGWKHLFAQKDTFHCYSNLITFRLPSAYSLSLIDKLSYLEVQIRHPETDYYQQHPVHLRVQDILASAVEIVCEQLSYSHARLQYGFHCECGEMDEEHIAITKLIPPFDYALCRYGSVTPTQLKHTHTIWLTEVSQI